MLDNDEICFLLRNQGVRFAKLKKHGNYFQIDMISEVYLDGLNLD